jgi:hypothetical protein
VISNTFCLLYVLQKADFDEIMENNLDMKATLQDDSKRRFIDMDMFVSSEFGEFPVKTNLINYKRRTSVVNCTQDYLKIGEDMADRVKRRPRYGGTIARRYSTGEADEATKLMKSTATTK